VSFFDDDAETQAPQAPPSRPRRKVDKRRMRIQRLVIFLAVLFVVVFLLALGVRQCQKTQKENTYRTYFTEINTAINDSNNVGKKIGAILANPTKYSKSELTAQLDTLVRGQAEITKRAQNIAAPSKLADLHTIFVLGMQVRQRGVEEVRAGLLSALTGKNAAAMAAKLSALGAYFTGPDVYYGELYQTQAQKVMADDGVKNVAVPSSDYFLTHTLFDATAIETALKRAASTNKTTGIHGVALVKVIAKPANVQLVAGKQTQVKSDPNLVFAVTVQNQGTVTETNVPVTVTFVPPGSGAPQTAKATIAAIGPNEQVSVDVGPISPAAAAISKPSTIKVDVAAVAGEQLTTNNQATYSIILQF